MAARALTPPTAPPLPRTLKIVQWIARGIGALSAVWGVVQYFVDDGLSWGVMAFVMPAVVPLVVVEFLVMRARERAAFAMTAAALGLQPQRRLLGQGLVGRYRDCDVELTTESSNVLGKGTCLTLAVSGLDGVAVGARRHSRALRAAAGGRSARCIEVRAAPPGMAKGNALEAYVAAADTSWDAALAEPEVVEQLARFAGCAHPERQGALLGNRVLRALYGRLQGLDEVRAFLDEAVDVVDAVRAARTRPH